MRRTVAAAVVALSTALTLLPATSSATTDGRGTPAAPATSQLVEQRASTVLAKVTAVLAGQSTEGQLSSQARPDATLALLDLFVALPDLSAEDRVTAATLLARPTDGPQQDPDGYTVPAKKRCAGNFCIHWVTSTSDAPPSSTWVNKNLTLLNQVWKLEVKKMGYRKPVKDGKHGGNSKLDVYLNDVGGQGLYGYCAPEYYAPGSKRRASGYCVLDNDFARSQFGAAPMDSLRVTAAHEFFHAIQFAYDFREDRWLLENTSTWMEERFADEVNDNRQYLPYGQMKQPAGSLDVFNQNGLNQYANWPFFEYLSSRYGNDIVRAIWNKAGTGEGAPNLYSTQAVKSVLKKEGGFTNVFRAYAGANTIPGRSYAEGGAWPSAALTRGWTLGKNARTATATIGINHLASRNVVIRPGQSLKGKRWMARITIDAPGRKTGAAAYIIIKKKTGGWVRKGIALTEKGYGKAQFGFDTSSVKAVSVVLVNASTRFRCHEGTNLSCAGNPVDQNLPFTFKTAVFKR